MKNLILLCLHSFQFGEELADFFLRFVLGQCHVSLCLPVSTDDHTAIELSVLGLAGLNLLETHTQHGGFILNLSHFDRLRLLFVQ